ncbi:hypothetical protein ACFE04_015694 [Oxalis oulophora]
MDPKPLYSNYGIGLTTSSLLASGVFTGKYNKGSIPPDSRFALENYKNLASRSLADDVLRKVNGLTPIADEFGVTLAQLSLAWCAVNPNVSSVISYHWCNKRVSVIPKLTPAVLERIEAVVQSKPKRAESYRLVPPEAVVHTHTNRLKSSNILKIVVIFGVTVVRILLAGSGMFTFLCYRRQKQKLWNVLEVSDRRASTDLTEEFSRNGLLYLHSNSENKPIIIHRNISVEKILIDREFQLMITDSGLHNLLADDFILSGKCMLTSSNRLTVESGRPSDFVDSELEAMKLGKLAISCTQEHPNDRSSMEEIAIRQMLQNVSQFEA